MVGILRVVVLHLVDKKAQLQGRLHKDLLLDLPLVHHHKELLQLEVLGNLHEMMVHSPKRLITKVCL